MNKSIMADNGYAMCSINEEFFMNAAFNMSADKWQSKLLKKNPTRTMLLCSRQSGKSTVSAAMALYRATYFHDTLVLVLSNTFRQAEETFRKIKKGLPFVTRFKKLTYETQTMLEFSNGSRIVALPAKQESIRSFSSVSLLIIDEAAQVSDEVYKTIRPMLAVSQGDIVALTTPFGKRGWFYEAWTNSDRWYKVKVTARDCPRITDEFLEEEIKEVGEWWVNQEYFCKFVDTESQFFTHQDVIDSIDSDLKVFHPSMVDFGPLRE